MRKLLKAIEPWYGWGLYAVTRIDQQERDFSDESEGEVGRFEVQWLGIHFAIEIGRTPPKVPAEDVAQRKALIAEQRRANEGCPA